LQLSLIPKRDAKAQSLMGRCTVQVRVTEPWKAIIHVFLRMMNAPGRETAAKKERPAGHEI
jgi:hypothetical protein